MSALDHKITTCSIGLDRFLDSCRNLVLIHLQPRSSSLPQHASVSDPVTRQNSLCHSSKPSLTCMALISQTTLDIRLDSFRSNLLGKHGVSGKCLVLSPTRRVSGAPAQPYCSSGSRVHLLPSHDKCSAVLVFQGYIYIYMY